MDEKKIEKKFRELVKKVNRLLRESNEELEVLFEELAEEKYRLPVAATKFSERTIKKVTGKEFERFMKAYISFSKLITKDSNPYEKNNLERYYIEIIESRKGFDPEKGEITNPKKLSKSLVSATNEWFKKFKEEKDEIREDYLSVFCEHHKITKSGLFVSLLIFALITMIKGIALHKLIEKYKKTLKVIGEETFSKVQYEKLKKKKLLGGLLFRGIRFETIEKPLEILEKGKIPRGVHWTPKWEVAALWAGLNMRSKVPIEEVDSLEKFKLVLKKMKSKRRKFTILINKKAALKEILKFLYESLGEKRKGKIEIKNKKLQINSEIHETSFGIGFIFSCFPGKTGLQYTGTKTLKYFQSIEPWEEEIWTLPDEVEIKDQTIDGVIGVTNLW